MIKSTIPRGLYLDHLVPGGPVEVMGKGISVHHNAMFIVIRLPDSDVFELVRPAEFDQPIAVKGPDGTEVISRYTPVIQDETCQTTQRPSD